LVRPGLRPVLRLALEGNALKPQERSVRGPRDRGDLGRVPELAKQAVVVLFRLRLVVTGLAGVHRQDHELFGLESGIDPVGALEASQEEPAGYQGNDGERHLGDDEAAAEEERRAAAARGPGFVLECVDQTLL
jgi:hypothetical protein